MTRRLPQYLSVKPNEGDIRTSLDAAVDCLRISPHIEVKDFQAGGLALPIVIATKVDNPIHVSVNLFTGEATGTAVGLTSFSWYASGSNEIQITALSGPPAGDNYRMSVLIAGAGS